MKMFLRILVILVIGGLFFLGGFLLGSNDPSTTVDTESLPTDAPKLDVALPGAKKEGEAVEAKIPPGSEKQSGEDNKEPANSKSEGKEPSAEPQKLAKLPEAPKLPGLPGKEAESKNTEAPPVEEPKEPATPAESLEKATASEPVKDNLPEQGEGKPSAKKPEEDTKKEVELKTPLSSPNRMGYSIEVGTFLERDLAEERAQEFKLREYPTFVVSAWDRHRQLWHTVRVGNYKDLTEARLAAREIQEKERINAHVYGIGTIRFDDLPVEDMAPTKAPAGNPENTNPAPDQNKESANVP